MSLLQQHNAGAPGPDARSASVIPPADGYFQLLPTVTPTVRGLAGHTSSLNRP